MKGFDGFSRLTWWNPHEIFRRRCAASGLGLFAAWLGVFALSIVSGLLTTSWNGLHWKFGHLPMAVSFYPPLTLCILLTLWVGPLWGIIPAYFTSLVLACHTGMPLATGAVFSLSTPITLIVLWSSMVGLEVSPSLRTWPDRLRFALLALISTGASSVGALVWIYENRMEFLQAQAIWQGWVVGDWVQIVLIVGPILYFLHQPAQAWLASRIPVPPRSHLGTRLYIAAFLLVFVVMLAVGASAVTLFLSSAAAARDSEAVLLNIENLHGAAFFALVYAVVFLASTVVFSSTLGSRYERQQREACTDELTKCLNRRAFADVFSVEADRSERLRLGLSLILLDVDGLKQINDEYGHVAADYILQSLAERIHQHTRRSDFLFRLGGDEFALLLPCTSLADASEFAERVRAGLSSEPFLVVPGGVRVTASLGVAGTTVFPALAEALLCQADEACYRAKDNGGNRVEVAEETPASHVLRAHHLLRSA